LLLVVLQIPIARAVWILAEFVIVHVYCELVALFALEVIPFTNEVRAGG